jgi:hypothetical protein
MDTEDLEEYVSHDATIRIAGSTLPLRAGKCAYHFLERGLSPIEFFCIGAAANQQATKSMGVFLYMVENSMRSQNMTVAFKPYRFRTSARDEGSAEMRDKDCTVWRTVIITK